MNKRTIQRLYSHVVDLKTTKCPCANDVALLGFVMNTTFDGEFVTSFRIGDAILYYMTVMFNWQYKLNMKA